MHTIVWFRRDLRLTDNPALTLATAIGGVTPVYIWDPEEEGAWQLGAASRWWLHHSLKSLAADVARLGSRLIVRRGRAPAVLCELVAETGAELVTWSTRIEPAARARERDVAAALARIGATARPQPGALLHDPDALRTQQGRPFQVFTPFWKALRPGLPAPLPPPEALAPVLEAVECLAVDDLDLLPSIDWASGLRASWRPGEAGAREALDAFVGGALADYRSGRDRPGQVGTSRLSPHLHWGEVTPAAVWRAVSDHAGEGTATLLRELGWREFAHHLLWHFPHTPDAPLKPAFAAFPWRSDAEGLRAWQRGETGFPLVDAGMRQLWATGWMHNRVRMVAASFLVKDLLVPWLDGARWFWDTLVDADLANNTLGWQWTAGCGADAAPWFRIFNPAAQGRRFDPSGDYVRRWVPELARLPNAHIHEPAAAPAAVLHEAGVRLGASYPAPLVDHAAARQRALDALAAIRGRS